MTCVNTRDSKRGESVERGQTTIRLPCELMDRLRREADKKGYTAKDLLVFLLWDYMELSKPEPDSVSARM